MSVPVLLDMLARDPALRSALVVGMVLAALVSALALRRSPATALLTFLTLSGLVLIASATLFGARDGIQYFDPARLRWCGTEVGLSLHRPEAFLNALLFVPFAFFATLLTRRPLIVAGSVVLLAVAIELLQGATGLGSCEVGDVVRNAFGGLVAVVSATALRLSVGRVHRRRR